MAVAYGPPELFPTLVAVYACACGRRVAASGTHVAEPPAYWVQIGADDYLCERCASEAEWSANQPTRDQVR
jgi:hypothetical protein